jgi:hypothetical protein
MTSCKIADSTLSKSSVPNWNRTLVSECHCWFAVLQTIPDLEAKRIQLNRRSRIHFPITPWIFPVDLNCPAEQWPWGWFGLWKKGMSRIFREVKGGWLIRLTSSVPSLSRQSKTVGTLKKGVFWDVTPCGSYKNRRFGGSWRLLHQGDKNRWTRNNTSCN